MEHAAERTFWEKACLPHEETFRPGDKPGTCRLPAKGTSADWRSDYRQMLGPLFFGNPLTFEETLNATI